MLWILHIISVDVGTLDAVPLEHARRDARCMMHYTREDGELRGCGVGGGVIMEEDKGIDYVTRPRRTLPLLFTVRLLIESKQ